MSDAVIIATRAVLFGAALVLFGSAAFFLYGYESTREPWQRHLLTLSAAVALAASLAWYLAQTVSMTGDPRDALHGVALWSVLTDTRFGKIGALRIGLLSAAVVGALALPAGRRLWVVAGGLGAATVSSFAWSGHGVMNDGPAGLLHLTSDVLHLLGAGIWIGALAPLTVLLAAGARSAPTSAPDIAHALEKFSGLGPLVVSMLILTGLVNSAFMIDFGQWRVALSSAYGLTLLTKLGLFAAMLVLAAMNRLRFAPALTAALSHSSAVADPLRRLRNSVLSETVLALLVIVAVAVLGTLEPPLSIP